MTNAHEFTLRLQDLLSRERVAMADFLAAVADFDRRSLWLDLGYASLFDYLHRELGLSKASTFLRASAARLLQRFPEVIEPLRDGRLCVSSMGELAKALTPENKDEVLPRFFHLSKREAKAVAAAIRPDEAPPRREVVTTIRVPEAPRVERFAPAGAQVPAGETSFSLGVVRPDERDLAAPAPTAPPAPALAPPLPQPPPSTMEPLTAELIRIHLTADQRFAEKYRKAKDLLSHARPGAGMAEVLEAALDALIERHEKRRGLVKRPLAKPRPSSNPRHVPAHVRRAVWKRDGGRCQYRLASGEICGSTVRCEIDHAFPSAAGGPSTVENCQVYCDVHNGLAARQFFGDDLMDRYTRNPRDRRPAGERGRGPADRPPATSPP